MKNTIQIKVNEKYNSVYSSLKVKLRLTQLMYLMKRVPNVQIISELIGCAYFDIYLFLICNYCKLTLHLLDKILCLTNTRI